MLFETESDLAYLDDLPDADIDGTGEILPTEQELSSYADVPEMQTPRRTGITWVAVACVLVMILASLGICAVAYLRRNADIRAYESAASLLEMRDYDGALAGFEAMGDFADAAYQAQRLQSNRDTYDKACTLLEAEEFDAALALFSSLGDYRESKRYATQEIFYREARKIMESADSAEDPIAAYLNAAALFSALDTYADSAALSGSCTLRVALLYLQNADYDTALSYLTVLTDADADVLYEAYDSACADRLFLDAAPKSLRAWDEGRIDDALALIAPYDARTFHVESVGELCRTMYRQMQKLASSLAADGSVRDYTAYYRANLYLYAIAEQLHSNHGAFSDDAELCEKLLDRTERAYGFYAAQTWLAQWYRSATPGKTARIDNTTAYCVTVRIHVALYDDDGVCYLEQTQEKTVESGETLDIFRAQKAPERWVLTWEILDVA